jgi:hypothetical protein
VPFWNEPIEKVARADRSAHEMHWVILLSGVGQVRRRDREIIEIGECTSLGAVIERLQSLHGRLPENSEAQVEVHGDDNFGSRITVTYSRELTAEEAELESRYASRRTRARGG